MIPSHKEMMFPILRFIDERGGVDRKEVCKFVAEYYKFNDDELSQRIPSGMLLYVNRAGWALSYFVRRLNLKPGMMKFIKTKARRALKSRKP